MRRHRSVWLWFCLSALALPASADEGRIPLHAAAQLHASGEYVLTRDIVIDEPIEIFVDGVVLDLNGHTVESTSSTSPAIIANLGLLSTPMTRGVTVRNGRVKGGAFGILIGAALGGRARVENVDIVGSGTGIQLAGLDEASVLRCRVRDVGWGIQVSGDPGQPVHGVVSGNLVHGTTEDGISVWYPVGIQIRDNVVLDPEGFGIYVRGEGNLVSGNIVFSAAQDALLIIGVGNRAENNVLARSGRSGIDTSSALGSDYVVLRGNVSSGNALQGAYVSGDHVLVEDSILSGNGDRGLYAGSGSDLLVYRDNLLLSNGGGAAGETVPGSLDDQGGNICGGPCP